MARTDIVAQLQTAETTQKARSKNNNIKTGEKSFKEQLKNVRSSEKQDKALTTSKPEKKSAEFLAGYSAQVSMDQNEELIIDSSLVDLVETILAMLAVPDTDGNSAKIEETVTAKLKQMADEGNLHIQTSEKGFQDKQVITIRQLTQLLAGIDSNREQVFPDGQNLTVEKMLLKAAQVSAKDLQGTKKNQGLPRLTSELSLKADLQGKIDKAEQIKTEPNPATDVRKLIDFENHRLSGRRIEESAVFKENQSADKAGEDGSKSISFLNRSDTGLLKTPAREAVSGANYRPVEAKEVIDQIVKKAELMIKQNSSEMKIDLKPEFLGRMTIKIFVDEGVVTARFITENHQVKHLLESNLNTLRQSLESQGIKVEKTEVNVQLNNGGMFDGSEDSRQSLWQRPEFSHHFRRSNEGEDDLVVEELIPLREINSPEDLYSINDEGNMSFII